MKPEAWLATQVDAPAALRTRMAEAVASVPADSGADLDETLARAAMNCLSGALEAGDDRTAALDLLAADALLTHGAAIAAQRGPDAAAHFAERWSVDALGHTVP